MKIYLKGPISAFIVRLFCGAAGHRLRSAGSNVSGVWRLDPERSDFGGGRVPSRIDVAVEHKEPSIRYSGTFIDQEGTSLSFDFEAMLDGRTRLSNVSGTINSKRVDVHTTRSEWRSEDGRRVEVTTLKASADGQLLRVKRHVDGPEGSFYSTEIYQKMHANQVMLSVTPVSEAPSRNSWRAEVFATDTLGGVAKTILERGLSKERLGARE